MNNNSNSKRGDGGVVGGGAAGAGGGMSAEDRKRMRLLAWKRKQEQQQGQQRQQQQDRAAAVAAPPPPPRPPAARISVSLVAGVVASQQRAKQKKKKKKKKATATAFSLATDFGEDGDDENEEDDDDDDDGDADIMGGSGGGAVLNSKGRKRRRRPQDLMEEPQNEQQQQAQQQEQQPPSNKRRRWDTPSTAATAAAAAFAPALSSSMPSPPSISRPIVQPQPEKDALDQFMEKLQEGAVGQVDIPATNSSTVDDTSGGGGASTAAVVSSGGVSIHVSGSMVRPMHSTMFVTAEQLQNNQVPYYHPKDWLSDTGGGGNASGTDDDEQQQQQEEQARRALIEALIGAAAAQPAPEQQQEPAQETATPAVAAQEQVQEDDAQLAVEVKTEKSRREHQLRLLQRQAALARQSAIEASAPELGPLYNDAEAGVMEEAERNLQAAIQSADNDALTILAAHVNKKKELKAVDHSKIDYIPFDKNLYIVPKSLASLSHDQVLNRRAKLKVRVRGHGAPAPVSSFEECGLSERILEILRRQEITQPFPVQAQCIPCIMAGRDVIGVAKTGSGKTLAYLLPMLRHILVQPPLVPNVESGPIGLVLAPARELAYQIHTVCKGFAKQLGLKSTAIYGGAGVAEQIGDLKRGTHIVVATPGRLIDILTMQSGKVLSLQRVTYTVMDEADRMFDMGFAPQITAILAAVRPDAQTVLFSATFPKAVETLARKSLQYPVEVIVGGRSVASDNVTQYAELVEEDEKFLRLLQILGEQVEGTKKVIVFVDTQVRADSLFEQLLRNGYPVLSLHGGKEQEDRDSTISDFKRKDGPNVLVATGVAGRGLDVPACSCVINYSAPNHLEQYVHAVGRTGRANFKGLAYTFVNSTDEDKYAPIVVRAMSEAGMAENISDSLKALADDFKARVEKGEARFAGSGFKGKGYTYDSSEMNEAQKVARLEKRQALIEAGLIDPDEEDPLFAEANSGDKKAEEDSDNKQSKESKAPGSVPTMEIPDNLTPELLALPGMKEALLRRAGIVSAAETKNEEDFAMDPSQGYPVQMAGNHWLQEFDINDYPREARWKVTQKDTTSRMQEEFRTAVTLKGSYFPPGKTPGSGERRLYLHLEATSETILRNAVLEIQRLLNEETLKVSAKSGIGGGGGSGGGSHRYNVLG